MKKLLLTLSTAALFSVAAMAQEQDTAREESNQFREMPPQEEDTTGTEDYQYRMDTTSFDEDLQQDTTGMSDQYRDLEDEEIRLDSTINDLNQEMEEGEENLNEDVREGEQNLREEGQEIDQAAEEAGNEMERSAEEARDTLEQSAEEAGEAMQNDSESAMQNNQDSESASEATASNEPVEVVEGKEGPKNEVVYEYKGEMFYVDRDKKEIVKVKRSDLKDSDHEVKVKDPLATDQKSDKKKRSKG